MKKVIGITGSIGSGKSYAVNQFRKICQKKNVKSTFIDVDDIRRKLLEQEKIDRIELNKKIYSNKDEMKKYKEFINPKIREYLVNYINNSNGYIFIEWALLLEDEFYDLVDLIIMINCNQNIQIERLENGDLGRENIIKRINLQLTNADKIEKIRKINKKYCIIDTSKNPKADVYRNFLEKEVLKSE